MTKDIWNVGIDIGSTTVKVVVLGPENDILFKRYARHQSRAREKMLEILNEAMPLLKDRTVTVAVSGSASFNISKFSDIPFVQEVFATRIAVSELLGDIDAVVELGGEDAKILFLTGGSEERMNGTCAGGTGAFIDQMASLMDVSVEELDALSEQATTMYNIASRCGVFAKSDIQPLLNQGAEKSDIAVSIYQAIVSQTIAGLAQGRAIKGRVAFLGGPLTFMRGLRKRFVETLRLAPENAVFPENAEYYVALGAALSSRKTGEPVSFHDLFYKLASTDTAASEFDTLPPLFETPADYEAFVARHNEHSVDTYDMSEYSGRAYLGIDCGSTTTKLLLMSEDDRILYTYYASNKGEPLAVTIGELKKIYALCGDRIRIASAAVTGYGEEHIKNVLKVDHGIVETVAHLYSAQHFNPEVDFIIDIGGQDIKCFKLNGGIIDSIMLNEACSSGCGSFISTFAAALGYEVEEFSRMGLFAKHPVNLGSRCTVFMNSSVKQAQKDGATVEDISAGLSISVVKNAIYKVIRARSSAELGRHIVAQGGTFLNDAVLRAFEQELGRDVVRPNIAGLMGAYGAALYAKEKAGGSEASTLLTASDLEGFTFKSTTGECRACTNRCKLIITTTSRGEKCVSGNRCERALGVKRAENKIDAYDFKLEKLLGLASRPGPRGKIGIPLGLSMYENLPFWHTLFTELGFEVITSGKSSRDLYTLGQHTIPSDTVCYPAKLMHGHVIKLIEAGAKSIFYPCMPYNFEEHQGDNHYNCPIVSYYSELLVNNMEELKSVRFLNPYLAIHNKKSFYEHMTNFLIGEFDVAKAEARRAIDAAYAAYDEYRESLFRYGDAALASGEEVIVLCGRPYHTDPEINHGIDKLLNSLGFAVISEDCIRPPAEKNRVNVLNQWTYHSRLYNAAYFSIGKPHVNVVQIVSFGCGLDAVTTDEMREILETHGEIYTQIKIDEINNLGAAKIRLRSLAHAIKERNAQKGNAHG